MRNVVPNGPYLMSHFREDSENLHLALSDDGIEFTDVNDGAPFLESTVGTRTMRDPFVGRAPDGSFHLVATDGWESRSIVHSRSDDLVNWSATELIPLMETVPGALNAWAPEFFIARSGVLRLIWSSALSHAPFTRESNGRIHWPSVKNPQCIWQVTTNDFRTFSTPAVFFAPGYTVIDASAYVDQEWSLLSFKDERGENRAGTDYKDIHLIQLDHSGLPFGEPWAAKTGPLVEGPNIFRTNGDLRLILDVFMTPDYAGMTSRDGRTWASGPLRLPARTKHASVIRLTSSEAARFELARREAR